MPEAVTFLAKRVLAMVGVLLAVSLVTFTALYAAPGSPEQAIVGPQNASPDVLASVRATYGLDRSVPEQYVSFLERAVRLDFGRSYQSGESVLHVIGERLAVTLPLGIAAFLLALAFGLGGGVLAALRRGTAVDRALVAVATVGASTPVYATGVLFLYVFGVVLGWFPVFGAGTGISDRAWHLVLPTITLALAGTAPILRMTRVAMVQALERDDVVFARARGVGERAVLVRYALRHALVLITTSSSIVLLFMLTATAVVEVTFNLRGVGAFVVTAVQNTDIPAVQGLVIVLAAFVVVVNLITDALQLLIDPRIQHGSHRAV
jgi:peptide/nickel transport system permease protein